MSSLKIRRTGASDYGQVTKALIAGNPGAGKTLISSTWPSPFYASAEGGLMSVADRSLPYTDIRKISDLLALKTVLAQSKEAVTEQFGFPVETVVVDTIDEIQRILIRERLEETKRDALALGDWNYLAEQMGAIVRGFRNLHMHVIFTCHVKEVTDSDTGRVSYKPQMQGSFSDQIAAQVDLALLLRTATKTEIVDNKPEKVTRRILQTYPDTMYEWIKDRSGKLPKEIDVDFHTDFARINEWIFGNVHLDEEKTKEVEVALPQLEPIRSAAEAVMVPRRGRRPAALAAAPALAVTPYVRPENVSESPTEVLEEQLDPEVIERLVGGLVPVQEEASVPEPVVETLPYGTVVKNPEKFMPSRSLSLKNLGHGTDIYCQNCGNEVENIRRSELSQVRFRAVLCEPCFTEKKR